MSLSAGAQSHLLKIFIPIIAELIKVLQDTITDVASNPCGNLISPLQTMTEQAIHKLTKRNNWKCILKEDAVTSV